MIAGSSAPPSGVAGVGLSTLHNSPSPAARRRDWERSDQAADTVRPQPTATYYVGGGRFILTAACKPRSAQRNVRRGRITSFTGAARARLLGLLHSLNRERIRRLPLMVTLTYPAVWPQDARVWKAHLDTFCKRLIRAYPYAAAIWKLEYQKRGAPHYHLLVFGAVYIPKKWLAQAWYEIVASGDRKHLSAGTQVKRVRSWRGVISYAAKYLGKVVDGGLIQWPGRFWGVVGRQHLPVEALVIPICWRAFYRARRYCLLYEATGHARQRRDSGKSSGLVGRGSPPWRAHPPSEWQGVKVLGEPSQLVQLLKLLA